MPIATGTVQMVDGKFITVDGTRYSAFAPSQIKCEVGDVVNFEYVEKAGVNKFGASVVYKNIKGNVYGKGGGAGAAAAAPRYSAGASGMVATKVGEPILSKDRLILRQNALTAAVNFVNHNSNTSSPEDVIRFAKIFESYTSGDADLKEVEESLSSSAAEE